MTIYNYSATLINGKEKSFKNFKGKVLLIVNTATKCGFAPQLKDLQTLYEKYKEKGFTVLAFPSNQFQNQEPGTNKETAEACRTNFGVTFPLFEKTDVNGANAHPIYDYLTTEKKGFIVPGIKWNFTKFLIDTQGNVVKRYSPTTSPKRIESDIRKLLPTSD